MRLLVAALAVLLAACGAREEGSAADRTRIPDAEGVVVDVAPDRMRLDGDRVFRLDPRVESFTARGHAPTALARWKERYVHIGLDEQREVVWVSGIGIVVKSDPPVVLYTGEIERVSKGRVFFRDGTVLRTRLAVSARGEAVATIDPKSHLIKEIRKQ